MFFISAAKSNNHATLLKGEKYDDDSENSIREIEAICSIYLTCGFTLTIIIIIMIHYNSTYVLHAEPQLYMSLCCGI